MKSLTSYHSPPDAKRIAPSFRHAIISLIAIIYFAIAIVEVLPEGPVYQKAYAAAEPVIALFGLKQRWNLFSPDIRHMNQYSTSIITMKDGTERMYEFPRVRNMDLVEKFKNQHLRSFETECWEAIRYKFFQPFGAQYLARCNWNPDNPPVFVRLIFNGSEIPTFQNYRKQAELDKFYTAQTTFPYEVPANFDPNDFGNGLKNSDNIGGQK